MHIELFDHLLLLAAIACAATLVRLLRHNEGVGRLYAILVGAQLIAAVLVMGQSHFAGVIALSAVTLTVIIPWLLEHLSRACFARGRFAWVEHLSRTRATLMPGSGLGRQLPILEGLSLLERRGVDAALAHFRRLADQVEGGVEEGVEEGAELAMIHEQIVAMLFHGQRWDEGIAHYERRFQAGYAALRPSLALGLLRAYGESGRLETAAGLLRALEEGPVGADPNTAELLGQARLTFLAYAGAVEPIDEVVRRRRFADLGLSPATAELFRGIAQARAGEPGQAVETLTKVEELAGPRDRRVLEASRSVLDQLRRAVGVDEVAASLGPELSGYVELVADRLREFVVATPPIRRHERPRVTYALMVLLSAVYGLHLLLDAGGMGLLEIGALSEDLWRGGSWGRVFTSAWIHIDLVGLLFDVYAIWLAGQLVERMLGPARMAVATLVAAVAGMAASVLVLAPLWDLGLGALAVVVPTGGNLMAVGAITAALWQLLPWRTPTLAARSRRNLVITLSLLLVASLLTSWPIGPGLGLAPASLLTTMLVATLVGVAVPIEQPRWAAWALGALALATVGANLVAAALVFGEDPEGYLVANRAQRCEIDGVIVDTPIGATRVSAGDSFFGIGPLVDGVVDSVELQDGSLIELAVHRGERGEDELALLALDESLADEVSVTAAGPLPEPFAALLADDAKGRWRARDLWRNGVRVARVVERSFEAAPGEEPVTLLLLASPASAIEHAPELYAAMLREARLSPEGPGRTRCRVE